MYSPIDHDGVGRGDINTRFDDGRTQQHVDALLVEVTHDPLQVALVHLTMGNRNTGLGHQLLQVGQALLDGVDLVVQDIGLAAAFELSQQGLANRILGLSPNKGLGYRHPGRLAPRLRHWVDQPIVLHFHASLRAAKSDYY